MFRSLTASVAACRSSIRLGSDAIRTRYVSDLNFGIQAYSRATLLPPSTQRFHEPELRRHSWKLAEAVGFQGNARHWSNFDGIIGVLRSSKTIQGSEKVRTAFNRLSETSMFLFFTSSAIPPRHSQYAFGSAYGPFRWNIASVVDAPDPT